MEGAYATIADCVDIIPSLAEVNDKSARLEAMLAQCLLDASRLIETDTFAPVGYFNKAGTVFEERTFYSKGIQYLWLSPYTEIEYINDEEDELIDIEMYQLNLDLAFLDVYSPREYYLKWMYRYCGSSWWQYRKIKVSAKWGFPCIPPDIVLAVKYMGCLMFLNGPQARMGLDSALDDNNEQRFRNTYGKIVSSWNDKLHHYWNMGIG